VTLIPAQEATCRGTGGRKDYQHPGPPRMAVGRLVCDDYGGEYDPDRDECPECGCLDAELVETGAGPGRFWGYRGLQPVLAARQVIPAFGIAGGRVLRRWYRAKGLTKTLLVQRVDKTTSRVSLLRSRKRRRLFAHGRASPASTTVRRAPTALAPGLREVLAGVGDPLKRRGVRHGLVVLRPAVCAVAAGGRSSRSPSGRRGRVASQGCWATGSSAVRASREAPQLPRGCSGTAGSSRRSRSRGVPPVVPPQVTNHGAAAGWTSTTSSGWTVNIISSRDSPTSSVTTVDRCPGLPPAPPKR